MPEITATTEPVYPFLIQVERPARCTWRTVSVCRDEKQGRFELDWHIKHIIPDYDGQRVRLIQVHVSGVAKDGKYQPMEMADHDRNPV